LKYIFIFFNLLATTAFCQTKGDLSIQYVNLTDTTVGKEIENTIIEEINSADSEHLFKRGFGYISLTIKQYSSSDTLYSYYIAPSLYAIKTKDINNKYPLFYTYVYGRLVTIYSSALGENTISLDFSSKSKARFRKKISLFLEKTVDRTFYDASGHKVFRDKHFRLDRFKFDSGKFVFVLKNNIYIVKKEKY